MRKTSHDGADSCSITSGKDNETKKSSTSFNKMTKSSIKRKVQNFSNESDDGIIEPLLQTNKEKFEIANRSAKYLLNKPKTESIHDKDNKVMDSYADKCSVPVSVSSNNNMITNNVQESPVSTSYNCGSAPIHNHMNTNIFSAYEASTGLITTKNHILVEIDNSKPGRYSPSPLIFTTAKIHTDSKTKLMEPVQVTPVPILSTIEGNIVKTGIVSDSETKPSCITKISCDDMTVVSENPDMNLSQTYKQTPTITQSAVTSSFDGSANLHHKDVKLVQLSNTANLPVVTNTVKDEHICLKEQPVLDILPTTHTNTKLDKVKQTMEKSSASYNKNKTDESSSMIKSKKGFHTLDNKDNKVSLDPVNLQNQENTQNIVKGAPEHRKTYFISNDSKLVTNTPVPSNKKLQRQKNASNESKNVSVTYNTIMKADMENLIKKIDNNISENDKVPKLENKNNIVALPLATSSEVLSKGITVTSSTEVNATPSAISASAPKVESMTATVNLKSNLTGMCKNVPNSQSQLSAVISQTKELKDTQEPKTTSLKTTAPSSSSKLTAISVSEKQDVLLPSSCPLQSVETDASFTSAITAVNTPLPSYIVSTSKTKIGSTLTSTTPTSTSKAQIQKPLVSVNTISAYASSDEKYLPSTSAANGTKHKKKSKETKSTVETLKKDGRA